jgi:signal transduction histidine kinase/ActR/RegA family two-component response regulator
MSEVARPISGTRQVHAAQVELLYQNVRIALPITVLAATVIARLEWNVVPHGRVLGWWAYSVAVAVARYLLMRRFHRSPERESQARSWGARFAMGAGLAGLGWGGAGVLLYSESVPSHQIMLIFAIGGMILGAASLLAPRPEAFLAFILPAGILPAIRLALGPDELHRAMALLACLFTLATLFTTFRIHFTILASLNLKFQNWDLVQDLEGARARAEALNDELEIRVQERTSALARSTEQLREEMLRREQMEEELLRTRKLESLGVLAGGLAHDFNNLLTVIQGNIELVKLDLHEEDEIRPTLEQSLDACKRAAFLSSQLLTFAKGGSPVRRLVSLRKLVADAVQLARAGSHTTFTLTVPEDLYAAEVDAGQIGQVLHNLLLNARQAVPDGGLVELTAENVTSEQADAPRVRISIRDYGAGIADDVLPRIFDPYFTTKAGGSGLGLATAHSIVRRHGGTITVKSRIGHGSVFTIDLPASLQIPEPEVQTSMSYQSGSGRLLVMDDEEALRRLLESLLGGLGYQVQSAGDGAEAIAIFEDALKTGEVFDAVLLDLTVTGGMGGKEAAARIREMDRSVKLIVSSGYSDAAVMSDFQTYGFDDVLPKPWVIGELSAVLKRVLVRSPIPE